MRNFYPSQRRFTFFIFLMLLAGSCKTVKPSESLQIATFNTFLRSPLMYCLQSPENLPDCLIHYEEVPEANAVAIATEILAGDYDIIAFNEVFGEDARKILVDRLSGKYPHFVSKIDEELLAGEILIDTSLMEGGTFEVDGDFLKIKDLLGGSLHTFKVKTAAPGQTPGTFLVKLNAEDSGLMIFSRFPFIDLPNNAFKWDSGELDGTTDQVAFTRFSSFADSDALAAKGAGLVRIQNPVNNTIYNVVFTHTQADYPPDDLYPEIRVKQLAEIRQMLEVTLGKDDLVRAHIFVMGDINIDGEGGVLDPGVSGGEAEWGAVFGTPGEFYFDVLTDSWAATGSKVDTGWTHPAGEGERLDYMLVNKNLLEQQFCVQHVTRAYIANSDHLLVKADYNTAAMHCHPRTAMNNPPTDEYIVGPTEIKNKGNVQWVFYDFGKPVTVSIAVDPESRWNPTTQEGVRFELYDPRDLSKPIDQYLTDTTIMKEVTDICERDYSINGQKHFERCDEVIGIKYVVPETFYIKVFSDNPDWTGDYDLLVHKHGCQSPADACVIKAAKPYELDEFKVGQPLNAEDRAWFKLDIVEEADSGMPQAVRIYTKGTPEGLYTDAFSTQANPTVEFDPFPKSFSSNTINNEGSHDGTANWFYTVTRNDISTGNTLEVAWETNLTILYGNEMVEAYPNATPMILKCLDETNPELGSDEIELRIGVDGGPLVTKFIKEYECNDGDVSFSVAAQVGVIRFVQEVRVQVVEEDDSSADDLSNTHTINTLDPADAEQRLGSRTFGFSGGKYRFDWNLSHTLNR